MSTVNFTLLFSLFRIHGFQQIRFAARILASASFHSAQMSKHPYADSGAEHLAPCKTFPCSDLGLESSWPVGLASWIKTLGLRFV
jgi:hypothetical protein